MDDLTEFLRGRIAEDEAGVRALAEPHDWHTGPGDDPTWEDESTVYVWPPEFHTPYEEDKHWRGLTTSGPALAAYIARHDPDRVLREVEAKRRLVDRHRPDREYPEWCAACRQPEPGWEYGIPEEFPCTTLRLLALPYADHPDYRPDWAPTA